MLRCSAIVRSLYVLLGGPNWEPLAWTEEVRAAFTEIKLALGQAPALGLPDIDRPFHFFTHGKECSLRAWYLGNGQCSNRQIKNLILWLQDGPCASELRATVLLIKVADKLTLGQTFNVKVPHTVVWLTSTQGYRFLSISQLTQSQSLVFENPRLTLKQCKNTKPGHLPSHRGGRT